MLASRVLKDNRAGARMAVAAKVQLSLGDAEACSLEDPSHVQLRVGVYRMSFDTLLVLSPHLLPELPLGGGACQCPADLRARTELWWFETEPSPVLSPELEVRPRQLSKVLGRLRHFLASFRHLFRKSAHCALKNPGPVPREWSPSFETSGRPCLRCDQIPGAHLLGISRPPGYKRLLLGRRRTKVCDRLCLWAIQHAR